MRLATAAGSLPELVWKAPEGSRASVQDVTPDDRYLILAITKLAGIIQTQRTPRSLFRLDLSAPQGSRQPEAISTSHDLDNTEINARISRDGKSLIFASGNSIYACRFPSQGDAPRKVAGFANEAHPFFSRDGRFLYAISDQSLYMHPVVNEPGGGLRLGERTLFFRLAHPSRVDSNLGAASRDGKHILAIATNIAEEAQVQILSDWTTLLSRCSFAYSTA